MQPENGVTVRPLIEPMFDPILWTEDYMDAQKWDARRDDNTTPTADGVDNHIRQIGDVLARVVLSCPFLLRKPWPMMFVTLFRCNKELRDLINSGDF